jgi:hypothetical protein
LQLPLKHIERACAAAALSLTTSLAAAHTCPPISFGPPHDSLDEAAIATLHTLFRHDARYESGGFLIEQNGSFRSSRPVTQRARTEVNYCIVLPRGAKLAGLYHTHVAGSELSARDRSNAARAGVPSYIGTIRDGTLLVVAPDSSRTRAIGASSVRGAPRPLAASAAQRPPPIDGLLASIRRFWALLSERWLDG